MCASRCWQLWCLVLSSGKCSVPSHSVWVASGSTSRLLLLPLLGPPRASLLLTLPCTCAWASRKEAVGRLQITAVLAWQHPSGLAGDRPHLCSCPGQILSDVFGSQLGQVLTRRAEFVSGGTRPRCHYQQWDKHRAWTKVITWLISEEVQTCGQRGLGICKELWLLHKCIVKCTFAYQIHSTQDIDHAIPDYPNVFLHDICKISPK